MEKIGKESAEHYSWGRGCDGWHLVKTKGVSIIEERMPPGTDEIRHYHKTSNQFFYVLQGELAIDVDGQDFALSSGQGIQVDAGQIHQVRNRTTVNAEFLLISTPPSHGDRVEVSQH